MSKLHDAYRYLGVPIGSPYDPVVKRRHRRLVMVWHPDRAPDDPKWKEEANEEIKKINHHHDIIKNHFQSGEHRNGNQRCACQPEVGEQTQSFHRRSQTARTGQERKQESGGAQESTAFKQGKVEQADDTERIKWRVAAAAGAVFVLIVIYAWMGLGIRSFIRGVQGKWQEWQHSWSNRDSSAEKIQRLSNGEGHKVPALGTYPRMRLDELRMRIAGNQANISVLGNELHHLRSNNDPANMVKMSDLNRRLNELRQQVEKDNWYLNNSQQGDGQLLPAR